MAQNDVEVNEPRMPCAGGRVKVDARSTRRRRWNRRRRQQQPRVQQNRRAIQALGAFRAGTSASGWLLGSRWGSQWWGSPSGLTSGLTSRHRTLHCSGRRGRLSTASRPARTRCRGRTRQRNPPTGTRGRCCAMHHAHAGFNERLILKAGTILTRKVDYGIEGKFTHGHMVPNGEQSSNRCSMKLDSGIASLPPPPHLNEITNIRDNPQNQTPLTPTCTAHIVTNCAGST